MNRFACIIGLCILGILLGTSAWAKSSITPISEMDLKFTPCAVQLDPGFEFVPMSMSAIPQYVVINDYGQSGDIQFADLMHLVRGEFDKTASFPPLVFSENSTVDYTLLVLSLTDAVIERWFYNREGAIASMKDNGYFYFSSITGRMDDITPQNLEVVAGERPGVSADMYSVLYSNDVGMMFFVPQKGGTIELWQGKSVLIKAQEIPDIAFIGRAFTSEGLTTVLASKGGAAYVYSYALQKVVPSGKFSLLANQAVKRGARGPSEGVFTSDFVIWRDKGGLAFADRSGRVSRIEQKEPPMDENCRPVLEGLRLQPTETTYFASVFPFDERRVVIEDAGYQRCVIVSPKE